MRWRVALVVLATIVAGCGTEPADRALGDDASTELAYRAFAECMRGRGANVGVPVLLPDGSVQIPPGDDGAFSSEAELQAAAEMCQPILSARGLPPPGPITLDEQAMEEVRGRSRAFAACLRKSGMDWPDPEWKEGAIVNWSDLGIDLQDPSTQAKGQECVAETGFDPLLAHAIADEH